MNDQEENYKGNMKGFILKFTNKNTNEQPTNKAISMKLLSDEDVPSHSTSCFDCLRVIMESLRRGNRI